MAAAPDVRLENVVKRFDEMTAVDGISVEIPHGWSGILYLAQGLQIPDIALGRDLSISEQQGRCRA